MLAPLLYKTLIFSLIEHHQSEFVRQFVVSNMALTIRRHQELPIGVLLDPLLRQLGEPTRESPAARRCRPPAAAAVLPPPPPPPPV